MTDQPTEAPSAAAERITCVDDLAGLIDYEIMAEIDRLRVTHAEFSRFVQEAQDMRKERDDARAALQEAERREAVVRARVWKLRPALDLAIKRLLEILPSYEESHEGGEIWRVISIGQKAMAETAGPTRAAPDRSDREGT